ncbi:sodium:calcium antiporter [Patescibacteria group bacterium]|nr:sodium:calcium antiporter [Patescibacteria group bacterium]
MFFYVLIFIASFLVLAWSSGFLVKSLTSLARFFSMSEYVMSFIFMSFITSLPELFVGFSSAANDIPEFSFGNVLGANLLKITLMMGLIVVLGNGLHISSKISKRNFWIISGFAFLPLLLAADGVLSGWDGLALLLAFTFYIVRLRREREYFTKTTAILNGNSFAVNHRRHHSILNIFEHLSRSFIGLFLLIISSCAIVWSGKYLAEGINLSFLSFGILFVAVGTSLPELIFGVRARMLKHGSMAIGNALGSIAFNSMFVLGLVSIMNPIRLVFSASLVSVVGFSVVAFLFFNGFVFSKSFISRKEGIVLLFIYASFLVFEYFSIII